MASRMDLFLRMIGGEENLPRKLTPPPEPEPEPVEVDVYDSEEYKNLPKSNSPYLFGDIEIPQPKPNSTRISQAPAFMYGNGDYALDGRKGEEAPRGLSFCPFLAVTKFCYKFTPRAWSQPLATAFFDQDKIYQREWDLYYISSSYGGVITFVAEHQLLALLDEINIAFPDANLVIDDWSRDGGLVIDFDDLPSHLRPRYLGRCTSRPQYRSWLFQQEQKEVSMDLPYEPTDRTLAAFQAKMRAAEDAGKTKSKAQRARKHEERLGQRQIVVKQSFRGQSYLGLYPKRDEGYLPDLGSTTLNAIDTTQPVPYAFDQEPIFIAIDVEAYEKPPRMVTEIGVATLDTRDLKGIAPGEVGKDWHKFIRGRHFRVLEYKHLRNYEYVKGCPDAFEFGDSEFIPKASIGGFLASCFREPYSRPESKEDDFPPLGSTPRPNTNAEAEKRNIIIVGHDLAQDVNYCRQVGFDVFGRGSVIDTMDTMNMFRAYKKDANARCSLSNIIYECDLTAWNPHNAGNDAVYTVQAMLAICVKEAAERNTPKAVEKRDAALEAKIDDLVEAAKDRAREDTEGWELEGEDGGVPVPPSQKDFERKPKQNMLYTIGGAPLDV